MLFLLFKDNYFIEFPKSFLAISCHYSSVFAPSYHSPSSVICSMSVSELARIVGSESPVNISIGKPPTIPADGGLRIRYGRATMHLPCLIKYPVDAVNSYYVVSLVVRIET